MNDTIKTFKNGVEYECDDSGFYTLYSPDGYYFSDTGNHIIGYAGANWKEANQTALKQVCTPCPEGRFCNLGDHF